MTSTPAVYPTSLVTFTTKVNHVDVYDDDHINKIQNEVIALQTYVGTNPHGNSSNLTTRLGVLLATNGAFAQGVAFPTGLVDGQVFYRTDLNGLYVYNGSSWDLQGGSIGNCLYNLAGLTNTQAQVVISADIAGSNVTPGSGNYMYRRQNGTSYATMWTTKWVKIPGVSTVTNMAEIWSITSGTAKYRVSIGNIVGSDGTSTNNSTFPEWITTVNNVSGLTNGTAYDVVLEVGGSVSQGHFIATLTGLGS